MYKVGNRWHKKNRGADLHTLPTPPSPTIITKLRIQNFMAFIITYNTPKLLVLSTYSYMYMTCLQDSYSRPACSCSPPCSTTVSHLSFTNRWTATTTMGSTVDYGPTMIIGTAGRLSHAAWRSWCPRRRPCSPSPRTSGGWRTAYSTRPLTGNRRWTLHHRPAPVTGRRLLVRRTGWPIHRTARPV